MVVSHKTANALMSIMRKYLTDEQIKMFVEDLQQVDGNRSFIDTVQLLSEIVRRELGAGDHKEETHE